MVRPDSGACSKRAMQSLITVPGTTNSTRILDDITCSECTRTAEKVHTSESMPLLLHCTSGLRISSGMLRNLLFTKQSPSK